MLKTYLVCEDEEEGLVQIQEVADPAGEVLQEFNKREATELLNSFLKNMDKGLFRGKKSETIIVGHFDGYFPDPYAIG